MYVGQRAKLELDMEQITGSKLGNEYDKAVYRNPAYARRRVTSMKNTPWYKDCQEKY